MRSEHPFEYISNNSLRTVLFNDEADDFNYEMYQINTSRQSVEDNK